ncbi:MAG: hypothetical protein LBH24_04280 [Clostridiales bacterium]|nr:hypothetical protein [Clostridiales bacterium]
MADLGEKIIELRLAARRSCMCEETENGRKKSTLSLKTKILFLLSRGAPPKAVMSELFIAKTNFSAIAKELFFERLIEKRRSPDDKRAVFYSLTQEGEAYLETRIERIERQWNVGGDMSETDAVELLDRTIRALNGGE